MSLGTLRLKKLQHTNGTDVATFDSSGAMDLSTIRSSTGNTAMSIDTAGRVTTSTRPAFLAYNSTNGWHNYAHGAARDMVWDSTRFNIGGHFNTSTGKFTAPVAGIYSFHAWGYAHSGAVGNYFYLQVNGVNKQTVLLHNNVDQETIRLYALRQLSANDVVHVQYLGGTDNSQNIYSSGDEQWTGFEGYLIG